MIRELNHVLKLASQLVDSSEFTFSHTYRVNSVVNSVFESEFGVNSVNSRVYSELTSSTGFSF